MARDESERRRQGERGDDHHRHKKRRSRTLDPEAAAAAAAAIDASDSPRRSRRRETLSGEQLDGLDDNLRRSRQRERRSREGHRRSTTQDGNRERDRDRHRSRKRAAGDGRERSRKSRPRTASAAYLEEGDGPRLRGGGGTHSDGTDRELLNEKERSAKYSKNKKKLYMLVAAALVVVIILIVVPAVVSHKNKSDGGGPVSDRPSKSNLDGLDPNSVPPQWKGTYLDPWSWADTSDFNVTFTDVTVGGLPVMGLMSDWDDSASANGQAPALSAAWGSYSDRPARGVNLGGWLSLEPFVTPSLFNYDRALGIIDEWSLCSHLGDRAASVLEHHYATFVTESTFKDMADAGLDHVRIPFSYWAVERYDSDPYVFRTSWRYLLRGIEWARRHGLRVNLDLHALPGSQNGWNHSGKWGTISWLNGTDGATNGQRSLDVHDRLSKFFAQPRYGNVISHYGLVNEPKMTALVVSDVTAWTQSALDLVRQNGIGAVVVFGDGFMGLEKWRGLLAGNENMALDVHQYVIFNADQITMTRSQKVAYACDGWTKQTEASMDTSTGFGPTLVAEWSQADTDCQRHLTNVGWGNRWTGTYVDKSVNGISVLEPRCPTKDGRCSCDGPAGSTDTGRYSNGYKQFLLMFAEAQMHSFEKGWGWWYWTWDAENAPLWSYKAGLAAGILPPKAYERAFDCSGDIPDWSDVAEYW